jgi:hypothetical protein
MAFCLVWVCRPVAISRRQPGTLGVSAKAPPRCAPSTYFSAKTQDLPGNDDELIGLYNAMGMPSNRFVLRPVRVSEQAAIRDSVRFWTRAWWRLVFIADRMFAHGPSSRDNRPCSRKHLSIHFRWNLLNK